MKYMVEFRLKPGHKEKMLAEFERIGPNRNEGVTFRGAWIGVHGEIVFALVEGDETRVAAAANAWKSHADATLHAVNDIDQI